MEMEVVVLLPTPSNVDFNFDSSCSSPYMTAPSSPQRFGNFFFSCPTSPSISRSTQPPSEDDQVIVNGDFEFDFSGQLDKISLSAEELFEGGKIRPLKVSSQLQSSDRRSPPETRKKQVAVLAQHQPKPSLDLEHHRVRGRASSSSSRSRRKESRSLPPLRVSDILISTEYEENSPRISSKAPFPPPPPPPPPPSSSSSFSSFLSSLTFSKGYRKWSFRDFLLFRSASEGRADDIKDPFRNYSTKKVVEEEDVKNSSFRSTESSGSMSRRRGTVSPHELHYTLNRAVSEELKKKTSLPYKHGLLGCMGFTSKMHDIARGIGSLTRG